MQDLCKDPRMFVDGFGRFDVAQGDLGEISVATNYIYVVIAETVYI